MSLWQTQSWQDMLLASGQIQEYFVIEIDFQSEKKQKIFVEKRKVSLGEYGLFVIGFDFFSLSSQEREFKGELYERLFEYLKELCIEENCLFAQIETLDYFLAPPSLYKGEDSGESGIGDFQKSQHYKKFIPPYTAVIDLTQSEQEILTAMKSKGRYNIKVAQKNGVNVIKVEKNQENIQKFYALMQETTSRDSFSGNTLGYYQKFLEQKNALLFFAEHEEALIVAGIFIQHEDIMYYYYGASANQKRNLMAPYLLQWTVIQYAKEIGCVLYDFLGIASPDDVNSSLVGVTDFKLKLTPDKRYVSKSFLFIEKKWKYQLILFLKYLKTYF